MLRALLLFVAAVLATSAVSAGSPPHSPTSLVIIACRVDDLTGQPGRLDPALAAKNWRDLEWHLDNGLEMECKREQLDLEDAVAANYAKSPSPLDEKDPTHAPVTGALYAEPLNPDFSDHSQCAREGMVQAALWGDKHPTWSVLAVGCPTPIVDESNKVVAWKLPECPEYKPGTGMHMHCKFDASLI